MLISILAVYSITAHPELFADAAFIPIYPWGGSLSERSDEILAAMRDDLTFMMDDTILPSPLTEIPTATGLVFNNLVGEEFGCFQEFIEPEIPMHLFDSELLSRALENICSDLTTEYW